ncbi:MAG: hypothetical protein AB4063_21195 [Crocosphaera sp.]
MEIKTKINQEQAKKIALIQEKTQETPEQVLLSALELYYKNISEKQLLDKMKNNLEKFNEIGFIGCIDAEFDLAEQTESILNEEMKESK